MFLPGTSDLGPLTSASLIVAGFIDSHHLTQFLPRLEL
jgi:hypothetical protein